MEKIKELPPDRISREEASQLLGVSLKAIDRYTKPGKTKPAKLNSKKTDQRESGGFITHFDRSEVEALQKQMQSTETEGQGDTQTALARHTAKPLNKRQSDTLTGRQFEQGDTSNRPTIRMQSLNLTDKVSIGIDEACELSGMSKTALLRGVHNNRIKHDHNGPGGSLRLSTKDVIKYAGTF